jgi:hypothetical protein
LRTGVQDLIPLRIRNCLAYRALTPEAARARFLRIQESNMNKTLIAIGFAGAFAVTATPGIAAPVMSSTQAVKAATTDHVTDVQWRRHHRGIGPGLAAGAIIGATAGVIAGAAAAPYGPYYDGPYYGPTYAPGYYEAPVASYDYYAPRDYYYAPRETLRTDSCRSYDGYGRTTSCDVGR